MTEEERGGSSKSAFPLVLCCLLISRSPVSRPGQQKHISNSFPAACRDERFSPVQMHCGSQWVAEKGTLRWQTYLQKV